MISIASAGSVLGGRYVLEHLIAVGGMGQVWRATDQVLDRAVAVKLLRTDLTGSDDFHGRFPAEARLAASLSHAGIAHVYDYSEYVSDGRRLGYLVMELVDGEPLSDQLRRGLPPLAEVMSILDQTGRALGAAHAVGIVHRDVKPGNLLITPDGRVKVTDFGIARAVDSADITEVGQVLGTARYMAPEQARGEEATPASDVYSLAIVGYEMLSGRTPFAGDSNVAIALAQAHESPPPLPTSVPAELRSLISRSLDRLPARRPTDGAAFSSELQRIPVDATPPTVDATSRVDSAWPRRSVRTTTMPATAVFQYPATTIGRPPDAAGDATETTPVVPSPSNRPVLAEGWVRQQRRRRLVAAWGAGLAVAACLLILIALDGGPDRISPTVASEAMTTTTAPPAAVATIVTIDPATYLGRTEADARAALTAAGFAALTTTTAPSTPDLAGLVIDVQPNGSVAAGSTVTITLGDGTIATVTDPPADDPGTGHGKGNGKNKGKGGG